MKVGRVRFKIKDIMSPVYKGLKKRLLKKTSIFEQNQQISIKDFNTNDGVIKKGDLENTQVLNQRNQSKDYRFDTEKGCDSNRQKSSIKDPINCRICLSDENDKNNPLLALC